LPHSIDARNILCGEGNMEQRLTVPFLTLFLLAPCAPAVARHSKSTQTELTAAPQSAPETTASTHANDADSLLVPEGTRLLVKVVNEFSSVDAKVGDVIDLVVVFTVRVGGITVIPKGTALSAKVVSVSRAGRGARGGQVKVAFDEFSLPTGEVASVRNPQHKASDAAKGTAEASGLAAGLFITAGVPLLALPFEKGDDQFFPAGATQVVSLNGPLRVSRKAAMQLQPAPSSAYVYIDPRLRDRMLWCGQTSLVIYGSNELLEMKLSPGTYWFSTERQKDQSARIDVVGGREYYVVRDRNGLTVREFQNDRNFLVSGLVLDEWDLTKLTPEESRSLAAQPVVKKNHSQVQKH
jgi:hypothetical protein